LVKEKKPIPPRSQNQVQEDLEKSKEGYEIALILTNSGSVARDHLALERTFLAYVRTSLVTASTGVGELCEKFAVILTTIVMIAVFLLFSFFYSLVCLVL
jgi:uncharacterized membrane protein YidH (DUF202 family)